MDQATARSGSAGKNIVIAVLAIVVVGLLLLLTVNQGDGPRAETPADAAGTTTPRDADARPDAPAAEPSMDPEVEQFLLSLAYRLESDPMAKGPVDAPVTMVEWADFQCGYCNKFAAETMPELQDYVDDGTLRIEYRDLALFGDESLQAATAARAAGEQGLFWEYHDALHSILNADSRRGVDNALLLDVARSVGVADMERFEAERNSETLRQAVLEQSEMARQIGISSTPTFLLGTELIQGAQPAEVFREVIERQAAATG